MREGLHKVLTEPASPSALFGHQYHEVKWWAIMYRNGQQELLIFLKNPKSTWSFEEWAENHKKFKDILEILKGGN